MTLIKSILLPIVLVPSVAQAANLSVPGTHPTVAAAALDATSGDVITILPGDYSGEGIVDLLGKDLQIIGSGPGVTTFPQFDINGLATVGFYDATLPCGGIAIDDSSTGGATTIDNVEASGCNQSDRIINIQGDLTVRNSTFTNIVIESPSLISGFWGDHVLDNVTFTDVTTTGPIGCTITVLNPVCSGGAGGSFWWSNLTVVDSSFDQCTGDDGACLWFGGGHNAWGTAFGEIEITNSSFTNSSGVSAGAIYAADFSSFTLTNSTISNNTTTAGGALWVDNSAADLLSSIVVNQNVITHNLGVGDGAAVNLMGFEFGALDVVAGVYQNTFCGNINSFGPSDLLLSKIDQTLVENNAFALGDGWSAMETRGSPTSLYHNTFAGQTGDGVLVTGGIAEDTLDAISTVFTDTSGVAIADGGGGIRGSHLGHWMTNGWSDTYPDVALNPNAVEQDPQFQGYVDQATTTCDTLNLWLTAASPMRDAGDPSLGFDLDGSAPDIGAYGGPGPLLFDTDLDGVYEDLDCDDLNNTIYPSAPEIPYDGVDQDCDTFDLIDVDGDGEDALIAGGVDCNDEDANIHTGATEIWYDGIDQNCDDADDYDQDGDGDASDQFSGTDCDDTDAAIHPGATEVWYDGIDQDCDDGDDFDQDGDGFAAVEGGGIDCDDTTQDVGPGVEEVWYDGIDQDCDGADDDQDSDGYGIDEDCDDLDVTINPRATDLTTDGVDQDCDGIDGVEDTTTTDSGSGNGGGSGCGCSQASGAPMGWTLLLLPMLALRRRR